MSKTALRFVWLSYVVRNGNTPQSSESSAKGAVLAPLLVEITETVVAVGVGILRSTWVAPAQRRQNDAQIKAVRP